MSVSSSGSHAMYQSFLNNKDYFGRVGYWDGFNMERSSVDWCERNYEVTDYIAEFFNTASASGMVLCGLAGMLYHYPLEKRIKLMFFTIVIVGLGSAAFHSTLLYHFQMMDEIPMIYSIMAFFYTLFEDKKTPKYGIWFPLTLAFWGGVITVMTAGSSGPLQYNSFRFTFAALNLVIIYRVFLILRENSGESTYSSLWKRGFFSYLVAFLAWLVDLEGCDWIEMNLPLNPQLHA